MTRFAMAGGTAAISAVAVLLAVPAGAGPEDQTLLLDPTSGLPGISVSWQANGFATCPPVDDAVPGGVVVLQWDGNEIDRVAVTETEGTTASTFVVPGEAGRGVHRATATCLGDPAMSDDRQFDVQQEVVLVRVPDVVGSSAVDARTTLEADKFAVEFTGDGDVVVRQEPPAGEEVEPGTRVVLVLGDSEPDPVPVPSVIGMRLEEAREAIEDAGLLMGATSGDLAGRVVEQSPGAQENALPRTGVAIRLEVVDMTVLVPDVVGMRLVRARDVLAARGLSVAVQSHAVGVVRSQRPAAGRRVVPGSRVHVRVGPAIPPEDRGGATEPDDDSGSAWTVLTLGGLVVLMAAGAGVVQSTVRRVRDRRWVTTHLCFEPRHGPATHTLKGIER